MEVTFQELRQKEVVSLETGARLGRVCDVSFNLITGCVLGLILPGKGFFSREDLFIPLSNVEKIGEDVILVRITHFGHEKKPVKPIMPNCPPGEGPVIEPKQCRPQEKGEPPNQRTETGRSLRDRDFEEDC